MRRSLSIAASAIRPLAPGDLPQVAELYHRVFIAADKSRTQPVALPVVQKAFAEVFLENPWYDEEIAPLVYEGARGEVLGFLGVTVRPMQYGWRRLRAAVTAHFAVKPGSGVPLVGIQLLKTFFNGPQDISIADFANDTGRKVWEGLGGATAPVYSMNWLRVLSPSRFALARAEEKFTGLRHCGFALQSVCRFSDALLARQMPHRFALPSPQATGCRLDNGELLKAMREFMAHDTLHPAYDEHELNWLLSRAARITQHGVWQKVGVRNAAGRLLGWYLYYLKPGGVSRVVQLVAQRQSINDVLDHLFAHAHERGSLAVAGRMEPQLMQGLRSKFCLIENQQHWYLAQAREAELLQPVYSGEAFLSRLEGELCTSFQGI